MSVRSCGASAAQLGQQAAADSRTAHEGEGRHLVSGKILRRDFEPVFPRTEITLKINPLSVLEYIYCADNLAYWRERGYRITYV